MRKPNTKDQQLIKTDYLKTLNRPRREQSGQEVHSPADGQTTATCGQEINILALVPWSFREHGTLKVPEIERYLPVRALVGVRHGELQKRKGLLTSWRPSTEPELWHGFREFAWHYLEAKLFPEPEMELCQNSSACGHGKAVGEGTRPLLHMQSFLNHP